MRSSLGLSKCISPTRVQASGRNFDSLRTGSQPLYSVVVSAACAPSPRGGDVGGGGGGSSGL